MEFIKRLSGSLGLIDDHSHLEDIALWPDKLKENADILSADEKKLVVML
jgi:hypothetical protein